MVPSLLGFAFLAGLNDGLFRFCSPALSHSTNAGTGFEPVLSCGNDVGGVEPNELDEGVVDKPGTMIGTWFSVLRCIRTPFFYETWLLTISPLI